MKQLPNPELYEQEIKYMPWGVMIEAIVELVAIQAKARGYVLDLMCGPGQLLGLIHKRRPDLHLTGVDIDQRYINYARRKYEDIEFILIWQPSISR